MWDKFANVNKGIGLFATNFSLTLGKLIGLEVQSQDLNARNPKKEEKYREIQTAIVDYVRQNCSCHKTVLVTTLPNTNQ